MYNIKQPPDIYLFHFDKYKMPGSSSYVVKEACGNVVLTHYWSKTG